MPSIRYAILSVLALISCETSGSLTSPAANEKEYMFPNTSISFKVVYISGGRFRPLGSTNNIEVKPFWIGKCEVTWDEYDVYRYGRHVDLEHPLRVSPTPVVPPDHGMGMGSHPFVGGKSWNVESYCNWLSRLFKKSFRIPTEEEWEIACGTMPLKESLDNYAWTADNSGGKYHEVGKKRPNALGLHDIIGNVWELCQSKDNETVLRGGAWNSSAADCLKNSRLKEQREWFVRDHNRPISRWWYTDAPFVGFRIVCEIEPGEK